MDFNIDPGLNNKSRKPVILIVDDNPTTIAIVSEYLKGTGFKILLAYNGEKALDIAHETPPDLIILDVIMPGIDGFETCRRFKAHPKLKDIPVIFLTSLTEIEDKVKGFQMGAVDYITKPLQHEEVIARINTHLKISQLTRNMQKKNKQLQSMTAILAKKAAQLEISSQVGRQVTSMLSLNRLLPQVVSLIRARFDFYFVGIWLLNKKKEVLILKAGAGVDMSKIGLLKLSVSKNAPESIFKRGCRISKPYFVSDVAKDKNYISIEAFNKTQSELLLPLDMGKEVIGLLDIRWNEIAKFKNEDVSVMQALANQIAIAIKNAQRYQFEKKLRFMEQERVTALEELNSSKDKFFSIFSHDLRNPFSALVGTSQVLVMNLDKLTREQVRKRAKSILESAKSALSLLENLLAWSRIQRGYMKSHPQRVNLKDVADSTLKMVEEKATSKKIFINNNIANSIYGFADKNMLEMVMRNLVINAIKFTDRNGRVTLSAHLLNGNSKRKGKISSNQSQWIEVMVKDTGIGISSEEIDKIFRPDIHYTRLGTRRESGTGLGLILCKEMVENDGGEIKVESQVNKGSVVKFTIKADQMNGGRL